MKVEAEFACPDCGKVVNIVSNDDDTKSVIHVLPMCLTFHRLDADDYLSWVDSKLGGQDV